MAVTKTKTNIGRNAIRDFLESDITQLAIGTGTSDPKTTDTALDSEVSSKSATGSTGADGEVSHEATWGTSEANGNDISELGTKDADDELQDRLTFNSVSKDNTFELKFRLTQTIENK